MQSHCSFEMPFVSHTLGFTNLTGPFSSLVSPLTRPLSRGHRQCSPLWLPTGHSEIWVGSTASFLGSSSSALPWLLSPGSPPCSSWKEQATISDSQHSSCTGLRDLWHLWPSHDTTAQMWVMLQGSTTLPTVNSSFEGKGRCALALAQGQMCNCFCEHLHSALWLCTGLAGRMWSVPVIELWGK